MRVSDKLESVVAERQAKGDSDQVSSTRNTNVRLEVGAAHRYNLVDTIQINDHALIIYAVRFVQVAPVGDAHL